MTKKLFLSLVAVGMMVAAGAATALTSGTTNLLKYPIDCSLNVNKSLPACALPPSSYTSTG